MNPTQPDCPRCGASGMAHHTHGCITNEVRVGQPPAVAPFPPGEIGVAVLRQPNPMNVGEFMYSAHAIPNLPVEQGRWVGKVYADALATLVIASAEWRRWEKGVDTLTKREKRADFIAAVRVIEMLHEGGSV